MDEETGEVGLPNRGHNDASISDNTKSVPAFVFLVGEFMYSK